MPVLDIGGRRVEVGDEFMAMTPEQQNATVGQIAQQLGIPAGQEGKTIEGPAQLRPFSPAERRPNPDGSYSTELSTTWQEPDGRWLNAPSLWMGPKGPQQFEDTDEQGILQAVRNFEQINGPTFSRFNSLGEAETAARARSDAGGAGAAPSTTIPDMLSGMDVAAQPAPVNQGMDAPVYVAQRANRGLAEAFGAPVDLASLGVNLTLAGADKLAGLFGGSVDTRIEKPFLGSDWIADRAAEANDVLGGTLVPPDAVSKGVRITGEGVRGGTAALVPAMGLASKTAQTASKISGPTVRSFTEPYKDAAGSVLVGDAIAGAGSGSGAQFYEETAPDAIKESAIGKMLASIIGGVGAATTTAVVGGTANAGKNTIRNAILGRDDPSGFVDPKTGNAFSRSDMDLGAEIAQRMASQPNRAADQIEGSNREFSTFTTPQERPTTAMLSDDIGLALGENVQRARNPQPFIERDAERQMAAVRQVDEAAPRGADGRNFTNEATRQYDETLDTARQGVNTAESALEARKAAVRAQNVDLEVARANQPQVSSAMAEDFDSARAAARAEKNARYDAADPNTAVDGRYLEEAVNRIDASMSEMERMNPGAYSAVAGRLRERLYTVDDEGERVLRDDFTYADLKALRAQIGEARKNAVSASGQSVAGSGADVERLDQLGRVVNYLADQINPEAARFYREEYAPRFKQGRAGEYGAARDRASRTGGESSATRPSEFGDKFLQKPEDTESFRRAMTPLPDNSPRLAGPEGATAPRPSTVDPKADQNSLEYWKGDLAKAGVLTDDDRVRFDKFKQWTDKRRAAYSQNPEAARYFDTELANAQRGAGLSRQLSEDIAAARNNLKSTETDLRRSALQSAIGNSPENAVASIMNSGDPENRMAEMVGRLKGNKDATEGLKAAVRDWIKQSSDTTAVIPGKDGARKPSRANLDKLFRQHEKTLAKIYTPEEMNALRRAHKLLDVEAILNTRATSGSNTLDKILAEQNAAVEQAMKMSEGGLKLWLGQLQGGGVMRSINLFLSTLPDKQAGVKALVEEMWLNPELAQHLLTRPVKAKVPIWNAKLNRLMAYATGARESINGDDTERKPLELTVTKPNGVE